MQSERDGEDHVKKRSRVFTLYEIHTSRGKSTLANS